MSSQSPEELETATLAFAQYLGIDIETEPELIEIAREALRDLPRGWEVCISEDGESALIPFFHNTYNDESVWNHPYEEVYFNKVKEERKYLHQQQHNTTKKSKDKDKDNDNERLQSKKEQNKYMLSDDHDDDDENEKEIMKDIPQHLSDLNPYPTLRPPWELCS